MHEARGVCFAAHHDSAIFPQMICFDVSVRRFACDYFCTITLISSQINIKLNTKQRCQFNIFGSNAACDVRPVFRGCFRRLGDAHQR